MSKREPWQLASCLATTPHPSPRAFFGLWIDILAPPLRLARTPCHQLVRLRRLPRLSATRRSAGPSRRSCSAQSRRDNGNINPSIAVVIPSARAAHPSKYNGLASSCREAVFAFPISTTASGATVHFHAAHSASVHHVTPTAAETTIMVVMMPSPAKTEVDARTIERFATVLHDSDAPPNQSHLDAR